MSARKATRKSSRKVTRKSTATTSRKTRKTTISKGKAVQQGVRTLFNARDAYMTEKIMKRVNSLFARTKTPTQRQVRFAVTGE